jgi:hypothetical protein
VSAQHVRELASRITRALARLSAPRCADPRDGKRPRSSFPPPFPRGLSVPAPTPAIVVPEPKTHDRRHLNAAVSKTVSGLIGLTRVRIPPPPLCDVSRHRRLMCREVPRAANRPRAAPTAEAMPQAVQLLRTGGFGSNADDRTRRSARSLPLHRPPRRTQPGGHHHRTTALTHTAWHSAGLASPAAATCRATPKR